MRFDFLHSCPIPTLTLPLKGRELGAFPFKGKAGMGMGEEQRIQMPQRFIGCEV
jgi:hypothetical protein